MAEVEEMPVVEQEVAEDVAAEGDEIVVPEAAEPTELAEAAETKQAGEDAEVEREGIVVPEAAEIAEDAEAVEAKQEVENEEAVAADTVIEAPGSGKHGDSGEVGEEAVAADALAAAPGNEDIGENSLVAEATLSLKRKRSSKAPSLEAMAARIKALQQVADQADAAVTDLEVAKRKRIDELEAQIEQERANADAAIAAKRNSATSKRVEAQKASQEYVRKQCEASLADLEASMPKKPKNAYFLFISELDLKGSTKERNKQSTELWAAKSPEEKQKYIDKGKEDADRYNAWCTSEEGEKVMSERNRILSECRATSREALADAVDAGMGVQALRAKPTLLETPVKKSRPTPVPASKEAPLDDAVAQEAEKADLLPQLRNLAGRPEVSALGRSHQELLDALKANQGMVNAAKHSLTSS